MNYEIYSSFEEVSFDHRIVSEKIHSSQHKNNKQTTNR